MLPLIAAAAAGAVLMGRTKPRTRVEKKVVLGAMSGTTYRVEEFPTANFVVVQAPDGSQGVFCRNHPNCKGPRFAWRSGRGNPQTLTAMVKDFGVVLPPVPGTSPNSSKTG